MTREVCTKCRTSVSSSVPSPVRRWWLSPISMSSCPASVLAPQCSLACVTSTSLIKDGSWWIANTLKRQGCCRDALICMCSGLKGVPGSWHCYTCNLGGCWPSRNTCFRCLAPRGCSAPLPKPRHQRETEALGRAPQRSPAVVPQRLGWCRHAFRLVAAMVMLRRFSRRFMVLGSRKTCQCR